MTGLFGDIDAADIPENPFYVAPGTYSCVLTEATIKPKTDGSGVGLAIKWVIDDEDSEYHKQNLSDWFNVYPDVAKEDLTQKQKQDLSRLRMRLTQLNFTTEEQNSLNPDELVGITAYVTVKESPDKEDPDKKYTNVVKVSLEEE